jgi:hypothetical protein
MMDYQNIRDVHIGNSSSPVKKVTVNTKRAAIVSKPAADSYEDMDVCFIPFSSFDKHSGINFI